MKPISIRALFCALVAATLTFASTRVASAAEERTAFDLLKEGNQYVGVQSKDKIVQIRSEKSIAALIPNNWFVVYYDPDARLKTTEVEFLDGKKIDVKRPFRLIEHTLGEDKILDKSKLKTDSDKAIKIATAEPLLKSLRLRATQLWLQNGDEGPVWKVRLWAAKAGNPAADVNIGEVYIATADGKVVRTDLHIDGAD